MTLTPVLDRLQSVRAHVRRLLFYEGACRVLLAAAAAAIVTFALDYSIPHLPREVRLAMLTGGLALTGMVTYRRLLRPLREPLTDDRIALVLERQYPDLGDRLISSLQLARSREQYPGFNSPELIDSLVREAVERTGPLDFHRVVRTERARRTGAWTVFTLTAVVSVAAWQSELTAIWFDRLLGGDLRWPLAVELDIRVPGDRVAKGDDFPVEVFVRKGHPAKASIMYRSADHREFETERLARRTETDFTYEFHRVSDSFEFWIEAGDFRSATYHVQALIPPRIERLSALLDYPAYTGLPDTSPERPEEGGHLKVPVGTKVMLRATANLPIVASQLLVGLRGQEQVVPSRVEGDDLKAPRVVTGRFQVLGDTEYSFSLTADNGLRTGVDPIRYTVRVIVDTAPVIKVVRPGVDKVVTPSATVPLVTEVTDDFGIASIQLVWRVMSGEAPPEKTIPFDITVNSDRYGAKKIESRTALDLAVLNAKEGDIIQYWIVAADFHDQPGPNVSKSHVYQLQVRSKNELERRLEETLMKVKEEVRKSSDMQANLRRTLDDAQTAVGDRDALTPPERDGLRAQVTRQRQVTQKAEVLSRQMGEVLDDLQSNRLWDAAAQARLGEIRKFLDTISAESSPKAADALTTGINARKGADRLQQFGEAGVRQTEAMASFDEILRRMDEWEDYQEIVRIVREMLEQQQEIQGRIKNVGGK